MSKIHICSFSSGLDDLSRKKQQSDLEVLKVLAANKRFSVFEATANPSIANTMDRIQGKYFKTAGGTYPWLNIELTESGRELLGITDEQI